MCKKKIHVSLCTSDQNTTIPRADLKCRKENRVKLTQVIQQQLIETLLKNILDNKK